MAAVEVTISGMLYDKLNRTTQNVVLIGEATLTGLGVGGGPIYPPTQPPGGGGSPPGIWGGPIDPYPDHGLPSPPGLWPPPGRPAHPIVIPPEQVPPDQQPPTTPPPGTVTPVPPPAGSSGWPVQPIVPPPYLVVQYPGVGPVYVTPPASPAAPTPTSSPEAPGRRG